MQERGRGLIASPEVLFNIPILVTLHQLFILLLIVVPLPLLLIRFLLALLLLLQLLLCLQPLLYFLLLLVLLHILIVLFFEVRVRLDLGLLDLLEHVVLLLNVHIDDE